MNVTNVCVETWRLWPGEQLKRFVGVRIVLEVDGRLTHIHTNEPVLCGRDVRVEGAQLHLLSLVLVSKCRRVVPRRLRPSRLVCLMCFGGHSVGRKHGMFGKRRRGSAGGNFTIEHS